jgi:alcohol dehydrogenase class IV
MNKEMIKEMNKEKNKEINKEMNKEINKEMSLKMDQLLFNFANMPYIQFGEGSFLSLDKLTLFKDAKSVLVITGKSSFVNTQEFDYLIKQLEKGERKYVHEMVMTEPSPSVVDTIVNRYRSKGMDLVIGIGGGSVLDTAKAVSAMLTKDNSVMDYLEGVGTMEHDGKKIPLIAVPTTSGTGSEATKNAVLSEVGIHGYKKSLRHDNFVPDIAIVDPSLTLNCPISITAASGMDALTQLIESYVSTQASPMTDALALSGIEMVGGSLLPVCTGRDKDIYLRSQMSYGALISGITLANAGLSTVHGYASSIGGLYDIPHGALCGTLLAETVKKSIYVLKNERQVHYLNKYAQIGRLLTGNASDSDQACEALVDYLENLVEVLGLPKLSSYGIKAEDAETIARLTSNKNNPAKLSVLDLKEIVINRL